MHSCCPFLPAAFWSVLLELEIWHGAGCSLLPFFILFKETSEWCCRWELGGCRVSAGAGRGRQEAAADEWLGGLAMGEMDGGRVAESRESRLEQGASGHGVGSGRCVGLGPRGMTRWRRTTPTGTQQSIFGFPVLPLCWRAGGGGCWLRGFRLQHSASAASLSFSDRRRRMG
ncbi:unnamed protein product [Linum trigynum]|uniref:Uncharacterized protein n=1 Tax=Linum trigynum TaxID=586398 RepID=A0AAV2FSR4_9ROSI